MRLLLLISLLHPFSVIGQAEKIYTRINDAVVRVHSTTNAGQSVGQGSGVVLADRGWLITNEHVLGLGSKLIAEHKGRDIELSGALLNDDLNDIIIATVNKDLLKQSHKNMPVIKLGNSDMLKPGQKIYAIASPMGYENSITEGLVSGIRTSAQTGETTIQFTAPVSPGSSGGGLFDEKGNLVGIIRSLTGGRAQNLNFAIPINRILKLAEEAKSNKPFHYSYYIKQGLEYAQLKKHPQAHKAFMQAIGTVPFDSSNLRRTLHYYAGISDYEMENLQGAIPHFLRAANFDTLRPQCYYYLGVSYGMEGDYKNAESYFEKAIEGNPYNRQAYTSYAATCVHQKKYAKAHELLKKSFSLEPGNTHGLTILASLYAIEKNFAAAQKTCFEILNQYPNEADIMLMLSEIYTELNQPKQADEWRNRAYRINPALKKQ